jgi:hypothetical protein
VQVSASSSAGHCSFDLRQRFLRFLQIILLSQARDNLDGAAGEGEGFAASRMQSNCIRTREFILLRTLISNR